MKTTITTAQAMSHPDVALTINTLGAMADELRAERDALKDAARLALDVLDDLRGIRMNEVEYLSVLRAIAALKAVNNPKRGNKYNWRGQPERLVYLGKQGHWHQFAKVGQESAVWCEVLDQDLYMLEETKAVL